MTRIIESKSEAGRQPFVELHVLHKPSDADAAWAVVRFDDPRPNRMPDAPYFPQGMAAESAYGEAIKLARLCDVRFVWVNDPLRLFPACARPKQDSGTP